MTAGFRCIHCGRSDEEPAKEKCRHPAWHIPSQPKQPGACGQCICNSENSDACSCCHVYPCEVE